MASQANAIAAMLTPIVKLKHDLLVLSGVSPANAPLLIRAARELGYQGLLSAETAQDAKVLEEGAGDLANGFISVGGASTRVTRAQRSRGARLSTGRRTLAKCCDTICRVDWASKPRNPVIRHRRRTGSPAALAHRAHVTGNETCCR